MDQIEIVTQSELRKGDIVLVQDSDDMLDDNGRLHLLTVDKATGPGGRICFQEKVSIEGVRTDVVHMHIPKPGRSIVRLGTRHHKPVIHIDAEVRTENDLWAQEEQLRGFDLGFACAVATMMKLHGNDADAAHVYVTNFKTVEELRAMGADAGDIETLKPVITRVLQRHPEYSKKNRKRRTRPPASVPTCRKCGCTEADCRGCVERTGTPCHWVEADLCSACVAVAPAGENPDPYAYVNRYYGLAIGDGSPVIETSTGRRGVVAKCEGSHIRIKWDDDRPTGTYHPTWNLEYPKPEVPD